MAFITTYKTTDGIRYRVMWTKPDGRKTGKSFRTRTRAERFRREVERSLDDGSYTDPARGRITLSDLWNEFRSAPPVPLARSTHTLYAMQMRVHVLPILGGMRIDRIQPGDIRSWMASLQDAGVAAASVNSAYRTLRRLLSFAVADRRIALNPAAGLQAPRSETREMRFMTIDEVRRIAAEVHPRYQTLIWTLAFTGLRIGEATALRISDLSLRDSPVRLQVMRASTEVGGRLVTGPTKTRKKRSVVLPPFLRDMLQQHVSTHGRPLDRGSLVFSAIQGGPIRENAFRKRVFQPAARRAGVDPPPRVHDLRHTAVAFAVAAGLHVKQIQEMLGHEKITTTLDTYGHVFRSLHEDGAKNLEGLYRASTGAGPV